MFVYVVSEVSPRRPGLGPTPRAKYREGRSRTIAVAVVGGGADAKARSLFYVMRAARAHQAHSPSTGKAQANHREQRRPAARPSRMRASRARALGGHCRARIWGAACRRVAQTRFDPVIRSTPPEGLELCASGGSAPGEGVVRSSGWRDWAQGSESGRDSVLPARNFATTPILGSMRCNGVGRHCCNGFVVRFRDHRASLSDSAPEAPVLVKIRALVAHARPALRATPSPDFGTAHLCEALGRAGPRTPEPRGRRTGCC